MYSVNTVPFFYQLCKYEVSSVNYHIFGTDLPEQSLNIGSVRTYNCAKGEEKDDIPSYIEYSEKTNLLILCQLSSLNSVIKKCIFFEIKGNYVI